MTIENTDVTTTSKTVQYKFHVPALDDTIVVAVIPKGIGSGYPDTAMLASLDAWALGVAASAASANSVAVTAKRHNVLDDNEDEIALD